MLNAEAWLTWSEGIDMDELGHALAAAPAVSARDLHVWEVTSGFPALIVVATNEDCCASASRPPARRQGGEPQGGSVPRPRRRVHCAAVGDLEAIARGGLFMLISTPSPHLPRRTCAGEQPSGRDDEHVDTPSHGGARDDGPGEAAETHGANA